MHPSLLQLPASMRVSVQYVHVPKNAYVCADCMFHLPSVPLFPGQGGTSLSPRL